MKCNRCLDFANNLRKFAFLKFQETAWRRWRPIRRLMPLEPIFLGFLCIA